MPHPERASLPDFDGLHDELAPALFAWAALRIHSSLSGFVEPQDFVQEVWVRVMRSKEPPRDFRAFVFGIAKNLMLESLREARASRGRARGSGTTTRVHALEGVPDSVTSVSRRLARDDSIRQFVEHVETLDPDDRRVLVHCGLEGMTAAEAGVRLGMTSEAAAKRWQRLRGRLKERGIGRELLVEAE